MDGGGLEFGQARCRCGDSYPAVRGCAVEGRGILCPDCAAAYGVRVQVRAAEINLRTARRARVAPPAFVRSAYQPKPFQRTPYQPKPWRPS
jgi:hypothetical protein